MATLTASTVRPAGSRRMPGVRPVVGLLAVVGIILVAWEVAKWLGGDPWREDSFLGTGLRLYHNPPFDWKPVNDINLPHVWVVIGAFFETAGGGTILQSLIGAALFTLRGAALGFAIGAAFGLGLAILLVHVRVLERGLVPLLVASQTVPIVAIAPLVVVGLKAGWLGVAIVASYLTFFPVTIAAIRGLRAADARAFELLRSYAADRRTVLRQLRLPASAPYLFTAFKISATGSVVGAIVGEFPAGIREGLGGAILQSMQYYSINPGRLWAAILVSAALGIGAFLLVLAAERWALRGYRPIEEGMA